MPKARSADLRERAATEVGEDRRSMAARFKVRTPAAINWRPPISWQPWPPPEIDHSAFDAVEVRL